MKTQTGIRKRDSLHTLGRDIIKNRWLYILLLPAVLHCFVFKYMPMYGLQIAFQDYNIFKGFEGSEWVGLEHFKAFFESPYCWRLIRNTLLLNIYGLVFSFPAPIILALAFNELKVTGKYRRIGQSAVYIPHFISSIVVVGILIQFLSPSTGLINNLRELVGADSIYFLSEAKYFRIIYTLMGIWKETGFGSIVYIAALSGIDQSLYEAAGIDGANRWGKLFHITLPSIAPTIIIMLIMRLGNLLDSGYESIILLYNSGIYETADVIQTFVYRNGLESYQYSYASAVGMFQSVVGLVLVVSANKISKKVSETSLW